MSSLPNWAAWAMVMACPLLGPVIAFLVVLAVAVLDRWVSGAREAAPRPAPELVQSEPAVAAPLGSLPTRLACAQVGLPWIAGGTSK
jgi:hypothetical protein